MNYFENGGSVVSMFIAWINDNKINPRKLYRPNISRIFTFSIAKKRIVFYSREFRNFLKMGAHKSVMTKKRIHELSEETHFTPTEIRHWHDGFLKDCPTGRLTKTEFAKIYRSFFPHGDPTSFAA